MSANRGRLVFAAAAFLLLIAAVVAVAVSGGSGDDGVAGDPCLTEWNDDPIALSDGVHAYDTHTYRATLLTRIDAEGELAPDALGEAPSPQARCAVIFASPKVDAEPDFGVRVLDGRWTGLVQADRAELDRIAELQRDATETANVTLLPDGRLAAN